MIKGYRISFKSSVLSQKCYKMLQGTLVFDQFHFYVTSDSKEIIKKILKFVDFPKPRKTRYLEDESLFCCYTSRATLWQKTLL